MLDFIRKIEKKFKKKLNFTEKITRMKFNVIEKNINTCKDNIQDLYKKVDKLTEMIKSTVTVS